MTYGFVELLLCKQIKPSYTEDRSIKLMLE